MSHIHIPDGVLPVSWWLIGYVFTGIFLFLAIRKIQAGDVKKKVPYIGVVCALMLITMSVPLGFLPFHINLTVLTGILAGPAMGFIAVFIVNLFLSFLGHGGITVVGVNTLILGIEVFMGAALFQLLRKRIKDIPAVVIATVFALLISTVMMAGIVGMSQVGWQYAMPHHHQADEQVESAHHDTAKTPLATTVTEVSVFKISGLVALVLILCIGIALEALVTVFMVRFFKKVRPDLIE